MYKLVHSTSQYTICFLAGMARGPTERTDARVYRFLYVSANIGDRGTIRRRRMAEDEAKKDLSCRKVFSC